MPGEKMGSEAQVLKNMQWKVYKSIKEVKKEMEEQNKMLVVRNGNVYDIQEFVEVTKHPGGKRVILKELGTDIAAKMTETKHSKRAYEILELHKVGFIEGVKVEESLEDRATNERLEVLGIDPKNLSSVMNKLDLNQGLVWQMWTVEMTFDEYLAFIHDPKLFTDSMRLFNSEFLEKFTKTQWYYIPMYWIPICLIQMYLAYDKHVSFFFHLFCFCFGIFAWTFLEYMIHRFIFHFLETNKNTGRFWRTVHFLFHGVHHAYPLDELRLVFPLFPATFIYPTLHFIFLLPFGYCKEAFMIGAGGILGYAFYDCIHYLVHHSKSENSIMTYLKRSHNKHHYRNPVRGYGVSTPLWDHVFNTYIED